MLFRFLRIKPRHVEDNEALVQVYQNVYGVLETYLKGQSAKNQLYCVRHFPLLCDHCYLWAKYEAACGTCNALVCFVLMSPVSDSGLIQRKMFVRLETNTSLQDELGWGAALVLLELVRNNKLIIERFPKTELDKVIKFVRRHKVEWTRE